VPFHSIRCKLRLARSGPVAVRVWTWIRGPFFTPKRIGRTRDPGLLWSQSMLPNLCFRKWQPFCAHNFKSQSAIQFFHYMLPLLPVQLWVVHRVNIIVRSNKFPSPTMIVVRHRKRVNAARQSMNDNLIGWWVGCPRPIELILSPGYRRSGVRDRSTNAFSLHFWGCQTFVSMEWKGTFRLAIQNPWEWICITIEIGNLVCAS